MLTQVAARLKWWWLRIKTQWQSIIMACQLYWIKRHGMTVVYVSSAQIQSRKMMAYKNDVVQHSGNVARVSVTLSPSEEFRAWCRQNVTGEVRIWSRMNGDINFIFGNPDEAFAFRMAWT